MDITLLIQELRRDEGVRYSPYLDSKGIKTVGVGHNMIANPLVNEIYPLTDDQVNDILSDDLKNIFSALDNNLPWWSSLDEVRQRILANMAFNMGIHTLLEFHNTLGAIQLGDYLGAANGMRNSAWAHQVGQRAERLAQAMQTGVM
jgi:lysozyme